MSNGVSVSQEAKAAAPLLVEMGLAQLCKKCVETRALVEQLNQRGRGIWLRAERVTYSNGEKDALDALVTDGLVVECPECKDTGIVPTERGWRVLGFVKAFVETASVRELGRVEEIPW